MTYLDSIAARYGTDKASTHPVHGHGYTKVYSELFSDIRHIALNIVEIGIGGGESIQTWIEYFPNARIVGVDKVRDTNPWNTPGNKHHQRYSAVCGDQSDPTFWKCFAVDYGENWDIVIDDGGHFANEIITTFEGLWPKIASRGLYCIEDLGVAYGAGTVFVPKGSPNHIDWLRGKVDTLNQEPDCDIEWIRFNRELAVFRKK